ncbi:Carboxylic ester hydrolase [Temnothorax longispinosus]|uniref:Carboxylic ester hydrolase n=1 Tax=Temnothorax longispinosus TaxID=300112 RepID=A0A4S2KW99_9HYME|nr:Carboxylic ester hydrolase [Temnothorax longispinosus]
MDNSRVEICVHEGKLIGIVEKGVYGDYYTAFRGIPYAKPPIGELRFKERKQFSFIFTPSLDHESSNPFFPEDPETFMCREVKVPFLLGFTSCEGSILICSDFNGHISKEDLEAVNSDFKKTILPRCLSTLSKISITIEELKSLYFGDKAVSEETLINYVNFISDEFVCRSIMEVVDIQTKLNNNDNKATYLYQFSYESENNPLRKIVKVQTPESVTHSEELAYLFHPYMIRNLGLSAPAVDSEDYKMINCLTQMWTDFAKTGNPTPTTNLWLSVTDSESGKYNYLNIDTNSQIKVFRKGEERWDWEKKKNKLRR